MAPDDCVLNKLNAHGPYFAVLLKRLVADFAGVSTGKAWGLVCAAALHLGCGGGSTGDEGDACGTTGALGGGAGAPRGCVCVGGGGVSGFGVGGGNVGKSGRGRDGCGGGGTGGRGFGQRPACAGCGAQDMPLGVCGRCRIVHYCNKACQSKRWKNHKHVCVQFNRILRLTHDDDASEEEEEEEEEEEVENEAGRKEEGEEEEEEEEGDADEDAGHGRSCGKPPHLY